MIQELMKSKKLSLRDVSKLSGVSTCTVMRIAQGWESVSFRNYKKVIKALGFKITFKKDED